MVRKGDDSRNAIDLLGAGQNILEVRVAVIFHRFGPYHCARLEAAAKHCEVIGVELGAETSEYAWEKVSEPKSFKRVALFPEGDSRAQSLAELETRMNATLTSDSPEVVAIPGWSDKGALIALRWCLDNQVPAVLMSETAADDEPRVWWKEFVKRRIVGLCLAALVGGKRHEDYLVALGMPRERIFTGYDVVDNGYFAQSANEGRIKKEELRNKYRLPENYFLASARFIPKKNLDGLIRAYAEYRRAGTSLPWSLVILGDGPLMADLRSLISDLGLQDSVLLPGFKQYDELPVYYGLANAFVHPSRVEQWGLVVNEAIACGLPVIVSNRCGCAPELVHEGGNGFLFNPNNQQGLASHLSMMSALSAEDRAAMGRVSQQIAKRFDAGMFGEGIRGAAECAVAHSAKNLSLFDRMFLWAALRFRP